VVAAIALDLIGVRVDGEDLIAALPEALVDDVAPVVPRLPGDARDRHPPVGQELRRRRFDLLHFRHLLHS
jgi:hypothetical protein